MKLLSDIVICMPTYNRPELVEDTLKYELPTLKEFKIDIYVYDSSNNDLTENIVNNYVNKGYDNLYYIRLDTKITLKEKVFSIYNFYGFKKQYKYLWLKNDVFSIRDTILNELKKYYNEKYDLVVINNKDREKLGVKKYTDVNKFFDDCAWRSTLFGAVILRIDLIKEVNLKDLERKYGEIEFYYVGLYFESILNIKDFNAIHIGTENGIFYSSLKKGSHWENKLFYVWCYCWQESIYMLPDVYINKDVTIKKLGVLSELFSRRAIANARIKGIYNFKTYRKYINRILKISDLKKGELLLISLTPKLVFKFIRGLMKIKNKILK